MHNNALHFSTRSAHAFPIAALVVALATLSAFSPEASATETNLGATNTTTLEVRGDNYDNDDTDDNYQVIVNRLNLNGNAGDIQTQLRLDSFYFVNTESGAGYVNRTRIERISAQFRRGDWTLTGGDLYQQFGRGLVLAIRKVDEAALDLSLLGGRVEYRGREHRFTALAGTTNAANMDAIEQVSLDDPRDTIVGWQYELRALDPVDIGLFGSYTDVRVRRFDEVSSVIQDTAEDEREYIVLQSASLSFSGLTPWLDLYVEGGFSARQDLDDQQNGGNVYGTADMYFGDTTMLFEGIFLDHYRLEGSPNTALGSERFRYHQQPTLMPIDAEVLNAQTAFGGRYRLGHYFYDADVDVWASLTMLLNEFNEPNELLQTQGFVGFKWTYDDGASYINGRGGFRDETSTNITRTEVREGVSGTLTNQWLQARTIGDLDLTWVQAFGDGNSLHTTIDSEFRTIGSGSDRGEQRRGSVYVGVERSGLGGITLEWGYDTADESQPPTLSTEELNMFLAAIAKWEISDRFTLTATGGSQRGGLKCASGVCRIYPPFTGGRFELVSRF